MNSVARDPRIDFIRGIAVMSMVVQHVGGVSFLSFAFGAGAFYVSAA
jgi:peptidoglycan/LPS O-acetylase OafA/YrhL